MDSLYYCMGQSVGNERQSKVAAASKRAGWMYRKVGSAGHSHWYAAAAKLLLFPSPIIVPRIARSVRARFEM